MKVLILILLTINIQNSEAFDFKAKLHSVSEGFDQSEAHIIKWSNGRVSFVDASDSEMLETLKSISPDEVMGVSIDKNANLAAMSTLETETENDQFLSSPDQEYLPTVLNSEADAQSALQRQRVPSYWQFNIQCYNMAHVRAYEEFKRTGMKSHKAFLFFTDSYLRNYGGKWWFHVTPMTYVQTNGKAEARILDREWISTPASTKVWTDKFIRSKKECAIAKKYSDYEMNQTGQDCYILPAAMYYWQPKDLIKLESGVMKTEFDMDEVNTAYRLDF